MAASVVQAKAAAANSVTSHTLTLDAPVAVGNVVLVQVYLSANSRTAHLTDDSVSGQTWAEVGTVPQDPVGSSDCRQYVWRTEASEAFSAITAIVSGGSVSSIHVQAAELAGVDATPTVIAQETYTDTADPVSAVGITTDAVDQFLAACVIKDSASEAWSASADWTQNNTTLRAQILTRDAPTVDTYGCSINWASSTNRDVAAVFVAFPVTGGGDPPDPPAAAVGSFIGGMF